MRPKTGALLCIPVLLLMGCCAKQEGVTRSVEDGIEVVHNPLAPPRPVAIVPTPVFTLDPGDEGLASAGLAELGDFAVDSAGSIYVVSAKTTESPLLKFDRAGRFVRAFSRVGQGPGEIQAQSTVTVGPADEVVVTDNGGRKIVIFDSDGRLVEERKFRGGIVEAALLPGDRFVTWTQILDAAGEYLTVYPLAIADAGLSPVSELDRQSVPNPLRQGRFPATYHIFSWSVSAGRIYSAFQDRGYEVWVHNFEGTLVRKVRKESAPVPVSDAFKQEYLELFAAPIFDDFRKQLQFPGTMPPLISLFSDDEGRLCVLTYETDPVTGAEVFDVFDPDGALIGRFSLDVFHDSAGCSATVRGGRLYAPVENDDGDKLLAVYDISFR